MDVPNQKYQAQTRLTDALVMALDKIALRELSSRLDPMTAELVCERIALKANEAVQYRPEIAEQLKPLIVILLTYFREHAGKGGDLPNTDWGSLLSRSDQRGVH